MIRGSRALWCHCPLAKDIICKGKIEFIAYYNEGQSMLLAIRGHLSKTVLERTY